MLVIRLAFWMVRVVMMTLVAGSLSGVLMLVAHHLLKELGQAGDQPIAATNDVQAAFVLMLFQDFVQTALKFVHGRLHLLPEWGLSQLSN